MLVMVYGRVCVCDVMSLCVCMCVQAEEGAGEEGPGCRGAVAPVDE